MKKNIALITGGPGGELEISLNSAKVIQSNLDATLFNVYLIVIEGFRWYWYYEDQKKAVVDKNDFSLVAGQQIVHFDCVFIAIHGTPGEDGKLQGYFELLNIPYTACDLFTSTLTFNKFFTNQVVENFGVRTGKMQIVKLDQAISQDFPIPFDFPVFVKPNKGGSSVGITKVKEHSALLPAIETAFRYDDEVLIQEALIGREITCGLFSSGGNITILPLCEIVSRKEFFDYEAKYTPGMADEILPAPVSEARAELCRNISVDLYNKLNCKGIVRFDYVMNGDDFYFLEVNTIPGLSEGSIVPRMARQMGMSMKELFTLVIEDAICWHGKRRKYFSPDNSSENQ